MWGTFNQAEVLSNDASPIYSPIEAMGHNASLQAGGLAAVRPELTVSLVSAADIRS